MASLRRVHTDGKVTKEDFREVVQAVIGSPGNDGTPLTADKLDLLYRVLDTDQDGVLDMKVCLGLLIKCPDRFDFDTLLEPELCIERCLIAVPRPFSEFT